MKYFTVLLVLVMAVLVCGCSEGESVRSFAAYYSDTRNDKLQDEINQSANEYLIACQIADSLRVINERNERNEAIKHMKSEACRQIMLSSTFSASHSDYMNWFRSFYANGGKVGGVSRFSECNCKSNHHNIHIAYRDFNYAETYGSMSVDIIIADGVGMIFNKKIYYTATECIADKMWTGHGNLYFMADSSGLSFHGCRITSATVYGDYK